MTIKQFLAQCRKHKGWRLSKGEIRLGLRCPIEVVGHLPVRRWRDYQKVGLNSDDAYYIIAAADNIMLSAKDNRKRILNLRSKLLAACGLMR